jgi:hypothetical protein
MNVCLGMSDYLFSLFTMSVIEPIATPIAQPILSAKAAIPKFPLTRKNKTKKVAAKKNIGKKISEI